MASIPHVFAEMVGVEFYCTGRLTARSVTPEGNDNGPVGPGH